jgi:type 1 glutamine amidotransferase
MMLAEKKILMPLGGLWHDFEGFTAAMTPMLAEAGCQVEPAYDLDRLLALDDTGVDIVLSYTSLSPHRDGQGDTSPELLTDAQVVALRDWVRRGGALLAAHSATVVGKSDPALGELMGGVFVEHPPQFAFTVYPVYGEHPITAGVEAFTVHDEFYVERLVGPVTVHMVAVDRGVAYPMVWSKVESRGRVAHVAMGHSALVWDLPPYRRLMLQALEWVAGARNGSA